jgi:hypothetical protein
VLQVASPALVKAVARFDPDRGVAPGRSSAWTSPTSRWSMTPSRSTLTDESAAA